MRILEDSKTRKFCLLYKLTGLNRHSFEKWVWCAHSEFLRSVIEIDGNQERKWLLMASCEYICCDIQNLNLLNLLNLLIEYQTVWNVPFFGFSFTSIHDSQDSRIPLPIRYQRFL